MNAKGRVQGRARVKVGQGLELDHGMHKRLNQIRNLQSSYNEVCITGCVNSLMAATSPCPTTLISLSFFHKSHGSSLFLNLFRRLETDFLSTLFSKRSVDGKY